MVLPGHLAGGYLATMAVLAVGDPALSSTSIAVILAIGTLAGDGPDTDLFLHYFNQKSKNPSTDENGHRRYITHTPVFWLVSSLLIVATGWSFDSTFIQYIGWAILAGSWSHLIFDSIEFGIRWLWPFTNKRFYLRHNVEPDIPGPKGSLSYYAKLIRQTAFKNVTFYAEIVVTIIALVVFFYTR